MSGENYKYIGRGANSLDIDELRLECVVSIMGRIVDGEAISTQEALEFHEELQEVLNFISGDMKSALCNFFAACHPEPFVKTLEKFE